MSWTKEEMAKVVAELEIKDGFYVNLGIGMPTLVSNYVPSGVEVVLHSENGMLGVGPFPTRDEVDGDLINAGKQTITELPYSSYFHSAESFAMIRGGHIDVTILGAFEVSEKGDIANWTIPGKMVKGMGGAMDLVSGAKRVVVMMEHLNKDGAHKLVANCAYPLTGSACVDRVVTNYGVFDFKDGVMYLRQMAHGITLERIIQHTSAKFELSEEIKNLQ